MLPYRDSRVVTIAIIIFFVLAAGYAYFEARGLLFGPRINLASTPQAVHDQLVVISGKTERISSLTMQGQPVNVTEAGEFSEPYLLSLGLNRILLEATDKYGRTSRQELQIAYTPDNDAVPLDVASSSPATSTEAVAH